jgi:hypothetical protein
VYEVVGEAAMAMICWSFVLMLLLTLTALVAPSQPLFQPPAGMSILDLFTCCHLYFLVLVSLLKASRKGTRPWDQADKKACIEQNGDAYLKCIFEHIMSTLFSEIDPIL